MRANRSQWARSRWWTCIRLAFDSIPAHLGRENHKFVFGHIARGARAREYETAIQWIVDSGLAMCVSLVDKFAKPLKFYCDLSAFKRICPACGAENHDWEHVNGEIVHCDYSSGKSYDYCTHCGKKKNIIDHNTW